MTREEALKILENMDESTFQAFFKALPYRTQLACRGGLVNWKDVLPEWYITQLKEVLSTKQTP
jgi:hypothetical protein